MTTALLAARDQTVLHELAKFPYPETDTYGAISAQPVPEKSGWLNITMFGPPNSPYKTTQINLVLCCCPNFPVRKPPEMYIKTKITHMWLSSYFTQEFSPTIVGPSYISGWLEVGGGILKHRGVITILRRFQDLLRLPCYHVFLPDEELQALYSQSPRLYWERVAADHAYPDPVTPDLIRQWEQDQTDKVFAHELKALTYTYHRKIPKLRLCWTPRTHSFYSSAPLNDVLKTVLLIHSQETHLFSSIPKALVLSILSHVVHDFYSPHQDDGLCHHLGPPSQAQVLIFRNLLTKMRSHELYESHVRNEGSFSVQIFLLGQDCPSSKFFMKVDPGTSLHEIKEEIFLIKGEGYEPGRFTLCHASVKRLSDEKTTLQEFGITGGLFVIQRICSGAEKPFWDTQAEAPRMAGETAD